MDERYCIKAFFDAKTYTLTYLVSDPATRDAVLIDPVLDYCPLASQTSTEAVEPVLAHVAATGLQVSYVLETHAHADHITACQLLRRRLGARLAIGARITAVQATFKELLGLPAELATDGSQFDRLLHDGDVLRAGSVAVRVLATPGHTPACVSYLIGDALFTGDALFIEDYGTGRCDFPGGDAAELYRSVHDRLYGLPPQTRVFPGHDYQPGGRPLRYETTIAAEQTSNIHVRSDTTEEAYVRFRRSRDATLTPPRLLYPSIQINIDAGRLPERRTLLVPLNWVHPTDECGQPLP